MSSWLWHQKQKFIQLVFCWELALNAFPPKWGLHPSSGSLCNFCRNLSNAFQVALVVKNLPANAGDIRNVGSVPEWGRSLEEEIATHSSILAWRISMDRGGYWAIARRAAKSRT